MSFLEGYGWGLAMFVFIGPVVFTLLRITLDKGNVAGTAVAIGIIVHSHRKRVFYQDRVVHSHGLFLLKSHPSHHQQMSAH